MSLPVAHALLGASVVALGSEKSLKQDWKPLLCGAFLGVCPDFDYLLNVVLVFGKGWHHDFTHSFAFAFLAGWLAAALSGRGQSRTALTYGLATLSHTLLDFLITGSRGVELCWPFSDRRFKFGLSSPLDYSWNQNSLWAAAIDIVKISLGELVFFAPVFLLALVLRQFLDKRAAAT